MKRVVVTEPAERDLNQIKTYLGDKAGPRVTRRVMKDIRRAFAMIGRRPGVGHVRDDLTSRPVRFWPIYSYLIVYDPETKPVHVIRVLHGMRDLPEILN